MGFKEDLAAAQSAQEETRDIDIAIGESLYTVRVKRLAGMQWAHVIAAAPPSDESGARLGYSASDAALEACKRYGKLLDADGNEVPVNDNSNGWKGVFDAISGLEVQAIAATWWALNSGDPNQKVVELKKALRRGKRTKRS